LGVRQNESIHQKLESHQASKGNPVSQQTLVGYVALPIAGKIHTLAALHCQSRHAAHLIAIQDAAIIFTP
jgi:hypothetical protein